MLKLASGVALRDFSPRDLGRGKFRGIHQRLAMKLTVGCNGVMDKSDGLNEKCPTEMQVFDDVVLSCWLLFGKLWSH